jgi:signal transduction histidine kinase
MNTDDSLMAVDDDEVLLLDDTAEVTQKESIPNPETHWIVLIVDDEPAIHHATQLALKDFAFENKALHILSAYSGKDAKQLIEQNPDIAFVLLDVVMETNNAGLQVIQYIREELKNRWTRIIIRTGQPGDAPEESVIIKYDINDYKLKVELTRQKLITTVFSVLRSYRDIKTIAQQNQQIKQNQWQISQHKKMSTIGKMVTGITHEINNPICFIEGNIQPALDYIEDLFGLIDLYQQELPNPSSKIQSYIAEIDLEYIYTDLPKSINSIKLGVQRIHEISNSMRIFARADSDRPILFNIHDGLDSAILILKHRLKANEHRPEIQVVRNYGELPLLECYAGQINQVFMNILANAIDALEESNQNKRYQEIQVLPNCINITTELDALEKFAIIRIHDNGEGMSDEIKSRIFENLFTTKAVGKGTGLGLAIVQQIVVNKHQGKIEVNSNPGQGTEFIISLPILYIKKELG